MSFGDYMLLCKLLNVKDLVLMMYNGFYNVFMDYVDYTDEYSYYERDSYAWGNDYYNLSDLFMLFNLSLMFVVVNF